MQPELVSPLFDHPLPDLDELYDWADGDARALLSAARRLAAWRREVDSWRIAAPRVRAHASGDRSSDQVTRTDLLRALLALHPEALGVSSLTDFSFGDAPGQWAAAIAEAPPRLEPGAVERTVARCWGLQRALDPTAPLDAHGIAGAIGFEGSIALADFDRLYTEGLITLRESACRILDDQGRAALGTMAGAPVLPVYLDRGGHLAEVDAALAAGPGVVIVSEKRGWGRHALVEAWLQRLLHRRRPEALAVVEAKSALYSLDVNRLNQDFFDTGDDAVLLGLAPGRRGAFLDLRPVAGGSPGWVQDLAALADEVRPPTEKLLVTIGGDRVHELAAAHPFYASLPRVEVRAPAEADALLLWWCQLPYLERRSGRAYGWPMLFEAFARASVEERGRADWRAVALAIGRLELERALDVRLDPGPLPWTRWRRALRALQSRKDVEMTEREFLERHLGAPERLLEVAEAEDRLTKRAKR